MSNSWKIFKRDIRKLRTNVIAIIVILGICILPSLYAWFNIAAIWNPYGNTGSIPVAVVNEDEGASIQGLNINIGHQIETSLKGNNKMDWQFISMDKAMKGIKNGKYYAVVNIPKEFSADMISFATGKITRPQLHYYVNEKKNAIAPKITDKGISSIENQVNESFVATIVTYFSSALKVTSQQGEITKEDVLEAINSGLSNAHESLDDLDSAIKMFYNNLMAIEGILDGTSTLGTASNKVLQDNLDKLISAQAKVNNLRDKLSSHDLTLLLPTLNDVSGKFQEAINSVTNAQSSVKAAVDLVPSLKATLEATKASLMSTDKIVENSLATIEKLQAKNNAFEISPAFVDVLNQAIKNPKEVGDFISSPVKIKTERVFPVDNYGSGMSPFYTTLAIWVGGIIMVAIMKTKVEEDENIHSITLRQAYAGRFGIFLIIGLIQATIIALGDLYFLQIQCHDPMLFLGTCLITSFIFTLIIYTLTVSFGNIGKALCVIWLVIQVAGSGGTFPIEVLPESFKLAAHFMPFTFACDAMRETIAGVCTSNYCHDILRLSVFIPISLLLGLILRNPLYRLNDFFEERLEETKFMG